MSLLTVRRRRLRGAATGPYEYLRPQNTLPSGMTFNATTGVVDGTVFSTAYSAPPTSTTVTTRSGLNTAIANAANGTGPRRIRLSTTGSFGGQSTLPANTTGEWIYIETETVQGGTFVAEGTRATPSDVSLMAKIGQTSTNAYCFNFASGATKYRFVGIDFTFDASFTPPAFDSGSDSNSNGFLNSAGSSATAGDYPSYIVVDRCVIRGQDGKKLERGLWLNGAYIAVIDSSFQHMLTGVGNDGQCFTFTSGPGPIKLVNNHMPIGNRGECFIIGGGDTGITPEHIELQRNHFEHPTAYHGVYEIKNLCEFKIGRYILFQRNVLNGYRTNGAVLSGQYYAFVAKSVNQNSFAGGSVAQTAHLTVMHNEWRNCSAFAQLSAIPEGQTPSPQPMQYVEFINNRQLRSTTDYTGLTRQAAIRIDIGTGTTGQNAALKDVRFLHNSVFFDRGTDIQFLLFNAAFDGGSTYNEAIRHTYSSNLLVAENGAASSVLWGNGAFNATMWNGIKGTTSTWTGNALTLTTATMPTGTTTAASVAAASLNNSTFALGGGSSFAGVGASGRDPGPVHALIDSAITGVV